MRLCVDDDEDDDADDDEGGGGGGERGGLPPIAAILGLLLTAAAAAAGDLLLMVCDGSALAMGDLDLEGEEVRDSKRRLLPEALTATGEPPIEEPLPEEPELD